MAPRYFLFVFLMIIGLKSNSQTLLNLELSEINKVILSHRGVLVHKSSNEAKFSYPTPPEGNICIFNTTCYFTSDQKCFKYINSYWGDELPNKEIIRLKEFYPNLKKIDDKPQWVEYNRGFMVTLINDKDIPAAYSLKIENINGKSKL